MSEPTNQPAHKHTTLCVQFCDCGKLIWSPDCPDNEVWDSLHDSVHCINCHRTYEPNTYFDDTSACVFCIACYDPGTDARNPEVVCGGHCDTEVEGLLRILVKL